MFRFYYGTRVWLHALCIWTTEAYERMERLLTTRARSDSRLNFNMRGANFVCRYLHFQDSSVHSQTEILYILPGDWFNAWLRRYIPALNADLSLVCNDMSHIRDGDILLALRGIPFIFMSYEFASVVIVIGCIVQHRRYQLLNIFQNRWPQPSLNLVSDEPFISSYPEQRSLCRSKTSSDMYYPHKRPLQPFSSQLHTLDPCLLLNSTLEPSQLLSTIWLSTPWLWVVERSTFTMESPRYCRSVFLALVKVRPF
jgi:hypothetical protein